MEEERRAVAVYSRKSKFTGKGESIENQIELCRQYIEGHFGKREILIYEDEGFSGGNLKRPRFQEMMRDAKGGRFSVIVVYRLDRISRNIGDFAKLIEELNLMGISFISIKEQFDTSSPMGRAMMYIASVFSQLERETIAERIRDNMQELSKTGRWLGGTTPTGYASECITSSLENGKTKKAFRLKLVPEEARIVRQIFDKFLESGSLKETEEFLAGAGICTKKGNPFSRFAIKNLLENPVYMTADERAYEFLVEEKVKLFSEKQEFDGVHGLMAYNRTIQTPGKAHQFREMGEWIVSVGGHEGMVSGDIWVRAFRLLKGNGNRNHRRTRSQTALLPGILFCGCCKSPMRPKVNGKENPKKEASYSYLCVQKEKSRKRDCQMVNVDGRLLDQKVWEALTELPEDEETFLEELLRERDRFLKNLQEEHGERKEFHRQLEKTEEEIHGLVAALGKAVGTKTEAYILNRIEELTRIKEKLEKELKRLEEEEGEDFGILGEELSCFRKAADCCSLEQRRLMVRELVEEIRWEGETAVLILKGAD